jgi:hypothetical protein
LLKRGLTPFAGGGKMGFGVAMADAMEWTEFAKKDEYYPHSD